VRTALASLALTALALLPSCNIPGSVGDSVGASVRTGIDTMGQEDVLTDLETIGTSPHIARILHDLTRDLIDTAAGAARGPEVEASLRTLIALAIEEIREGLDDVPGAIGESMDALLTDAEAMVSRIVRRAMRDARGMVDGDDVSGWVRGLAHDLLGDLVTLADEVLDEGSAEALGSWMRRALSELLRDVELEESTERIARAAARGFSQGIAQELRNDGGLGGALHEETRQLGESLRAASHDAAQPWIFVVCGLVVVMAIGGYFFYRAHRERVELKESLERDGNRTAREVIHEVQRKGIKVAAKEQPLASPPPMDGPME
jgi:hypothetical protein